MAHEHEFLVVPVWEGSDPDVSDLEEVRRWPRKEARQLPTKA
jgi:hypothetical protein